ncbi:MAG: hypothetical protein WBN11_12645 [Eudoraea sp.]|uniref:tetratricopeptide repeat protein n=1 Tax=Eudoraea sp. TaxID=1979955 RepID=UPI003C78076B
MKREMLIEKFIQGRLSEKEQQEFDMLVREDPKFSAEVDFHTNLLRVTEAEEDDNFREMLSGFESDANLNTEEDGLKNITSDIESEPILGKATQKRFPTKWLVAASIILLMGFGYYFIVMSQPTTQELFAQNFTPYPNVVHPIVRGEEGQESKTKAFAAYQNGEYTSALALFTELYSESEEPDYLFYQANALLQLNRGREAIPLLQEHLETADTLTEKSDWYLAMAYLQVDDTENAKKMLQTVLDKGEFNVEEAKKLLQSLK